MARIVLLDTATHRDLCVDMRPDARLGDARHFERVVVSEFAEAAAQYPILLAKDADTGAFFAGAVMGFVPGENLLLRDGRRTSYRPLGIRREPFFISGEDIAIDLDHPRVAADHGEPLFDERGEPTACLKEAQTALARLMTGVEQTSAFIKALLALDLVEPIDIALNFDDGEQCRLDGLYTISNDTLHELPDGDVLSLFRSGYLELAQVMIASLRQIPVLARARNDRLLAQPDQFPVR